MCMIVYYKCILDGSVGLKFLTTCILVFKKYFFVDSLSLLCLTCFKAGDVKWTTDDTGTIFHVNIFFRWEREECSKSVVHHGWDPSLTVLVIGDDNKTWLERTLNCKATEVVWIVMDDDVKGWGGYVNPLTIWIILKVNISAPHFPRKETENEIKWNKIKERKTPEANRITFLSLLFIFQKPCSKYFTFNIPLKSYRVLVCKFVSVLCSSL